VHTWFKLFQGVYETPFNDAKAKTRLAFSKGDLKMNTNLAKAVMTVSLILMAMPALADDHDSTQRIGADIAYIQPELNDAWAGGLLTYAYIMDTQVSFTAKSGYLTTRDATGRTGTYSQYMIPLYFGAQWTYADNFPYVSAGLGIEWTFANFEASAQGEDYFSPPSYSDIDTYYAGKLGIGYRLADFDLGMNLYFPDLFTAEDENYEDSSYYVFITLGWSMEL